jgi:hypothetical protein
MGRSDLAQSRVWPPDRHGTPKPSFHGKPLTSGRATDGAASAVEVRHDLSAAEVQRELGRAFIEPSNNTEAHEREIKSLSHKTGATPSEVRALFAVEFARLKIGAKVASYLAVLTESNVRGMLRRNARVAPEFVGAPGRAVAPATR